MAILFETTKDTYQARRKAKLKNYNRLILARMYHGDADLDLRCCVTGEPGFVNWPDIVTGKDKNRFQLDFNHIRQYQNGLCRAGVSVVKNGKDPSGIFRERSLDNVYYLNNLVEFMTIMPTVNWAHTFISQDSAKITSPWLTIQKSSGPGCSKQKRTLMSSARNSTSKESTTVGSLTN